MLFNKRDDTLYTSVVRQRVADAAGAATTKGGHMGDALNTIALALASLSGGTTANTVIALAAAGTIAMALLQVIKELTPLRRAFQHRWIDRWIDAQAAAAAKSVPPLTAIPSDAKNSLVELATGGQANAFYDLPIEQLVAQVNAAAQVVLDYPKDSESLLIVLSEGAPPDDVRSILEGTRPATAPSQAYLDARSRVGHRIQRNLDGVQIALGARWKFWMQVASITLSTAVIEAAVLSTPQTTVGAALAALPIGIVGGYLAPVTRDLVAALQNLRKP
jgi:hypothetical protein